MMMKVNVEKRSKVGNINEVYMRDYNKGVHQRRVYKLR